MPRGGAVRAGSDGGQFVLLRVSWLNHRRLKSEDLRLSRFRQALLGAQRTRGYQEPLRAAGLDSPRAIRAVRSIEEGLVRLPSINYEQIRAAPEDFRNPDAPPQQPQRLWCPLGGSALRVAVIGSGFEESEAVRVFSTADPRAIRELDPELVAAPVDTLLNWAAERRAVPIAHRGIIAFTSLAVASMPETTREFLWRAFEVPVFEQWAGADGSVLAAECEAHEGLHVFDGTAVVEQEAGNRVVVTSLVDRRHPTLRVTAEFTGRLVTEPCACGQPGPRLTGVKTTVIERPSGAGVLA